MGTAIDVSDIELKIARAEKHLSELDAQITEWLDIHTIGVVYDHDPKTGWHVVRGQNVPEAPREWGAALGDFGYNLRAALEYIVEVLLVANGSAPERTNQFPIISDSREAHLITVQLAGVHPDAIKAIGDIQPYKRRKGAERDPLEIIGSLANVDKHHRLHSPLVLAKRADAGSFYITPSGPPGSEVKWSQFRVPSLTHQPVSEARLFAFHIDPHDAKIEVKMHDGYRVPVAVEFSNGAPFRRDALPNLIVEVRAILDLLRPWMSATP